MLSLTIPPGNFDRIFLVYSRGPVKFSPKMVAVIRATLISIGLIFVLLSFKSFFLDTSLWLIKGKNWSSNNITAICGIIAFGAGVLWIKGWDWLTWIRGFLGGSQLIFGRITLLIAGALILGGALNAEAIGITCSFLLIFVGIVALLICPTAEKANPPDHYHRRHLAERLSDFLRQEPKNIRRIGILAEWGEGKTQILKMLEATFRRDNSAKNFRMAWVNPWRASSDKEAWMEIARGVDDALGFPRLLPQSILSIPGLGSMLAFLPNPISGFTSDLKTLFTSDGDQAEKIAYGLNNFLARRSQWILLFIDDMERTPPEKLRQLFPIIDRLAELERCYFIFAIDPKRISKAFNETGNHGDETKGYLDKILDFQMSLPAGSKGETFDMLNESVDKSHLPKFSAVLPKLKKFLPTNPRLANRLLREADGRERMFLSRFGENEENYEGFFLLLILEIRFPKFFAKIAEEKKFFESIRISELFGESAQTAESKINTLIENENLNPLDKIEIREILKRLYHLTLILLRHDDGEKSLDLDWALEGYRKLIRLTLQERDSFINRWRSEAGRTPLALMLKTIGNFSEPELVILQSFEREIESIKQMLQDVYRVHFEEQSLAELEEQISLRIQNFINHSRAIHLGNLGPLDHLVFGKELFDIWMKAATSTPLRNLPESFIKKISNLRTELARSLINLLPDSEQYYLALVGIDDLIGASVDSPMIDQLKRELGIVKEEIMNKFTGEFIHLLRTDFIHNFYPPRWMSQSSINELRDPWSWLPHNVEKSIKYLDELIQESKNNEILRTNFSWIIRRNLLNAYRLSSHDGYREQEHTRTAIRSFPWYIKKCWEGAWSGPLALGIKKDLIRLRDFALKIESSSPQDKSIVDIIKQLEERNTP